MDFDFNPKNLLDYLFPNLATNGVILTDDEASALYRIWNDSPPGSFKFRTPMSVDKRSLTALKSKGYITGYGDALELTERGRKVLVEMVTNEPNAFEKKSEISYSKIQSKKASMRPVQAHVKRAAKNETEKKNVFNLKMKREADARNANSDGAAGS
jgi:hypothetical protein